MLRIYWVTLLLIVSTLINAQYQNPFSLKWKQINTKHFKVVFPENLTNRGIETAVTLEEVYKPVGYSLKTYPPKISVFLFNQSIISNGYVALAPRHSVFYTTPPQNANLIGGTGWIQSLSLHEYRHVVQYAKLDQNVTSFFGALFGDYGKILLMNWSVPLWVFEGDAVGIETALSDGGRGRLPSFVRDIRALESEHIRYSYSQSFLGSYKVYFSNYYQLGYLMTTDIRKNNNVDTWNSILSRVSKFSFYPYAFSGSLKKYTGLNVNRTFHKTLDNYRLLWSINNIENSYTDFKVINSKSKKVWTNYTYPFPLSSGPVIALKSGMDNAPGLVLITGEKEKKLIKIIPVDRVHSNGKVIVWSSEIPGLRWGERSFSDIMLYNIATKTKKRLTHREKYFAPAISPSGNEIAAIEYSAEMKCSIVIVDATSGREIENYTIADSSFARTPSWSDDEQRIVFTINSGQLITIAVLDRNKKNISLVLPYSNENITSPVFYGNYIIFNSPLTGVDEIHGININSGLRYRVANGQYGTYNPSISEDGKIYLQNYSIKGFNIVECMPDTLGWVPFINEKSFHDQTYKYLVEQEKHGNIFKSNFSDSLPDYMVKKYHPLLHSIDIHSWAPYPVNNGIGFSVVSNDKLNTTALIAGINYFPNDASHREFLNLTYAGWFPVFSFEMSLGSKYEAEKDSLGENRNNKLNEKILKADFSLPINLSRGIFTTNILLNSGYTYTELANPDFTADIQTNYTVSALEYGLNFSSIKKKAFRDIQPRFGQVIDFRYWNTLFDVGNSGYRFLGQAVLYFPGIFKNHGITLKSGYQQNSEYFRRGISRLTSDMETIRGYQRYLSDELIKGTIIYSFPIVYPDLQIGRVLFFRRISTNLFYDHGLLEYQNTSYTINSTGIDLNTEINFFSIPIPIEMGVRIAYRFLDDTYAVQFTLFSIAF